MVGSLRTVPSAWSVPSAAPDPIVVAALPTSTCPDSFAHVLEHFAATNPEGVVNDRWGTTHWDFRTSEYQAGTDLEGGEPWENCRGIGLSFGYNQLEDDLGLALDGPGAVRHLADVVSRGGNFLLNVGPDAAGRIPAPQQACLEGLAAWMVHHRRAVIGAGPVPTEVARPGSAPWVRWTEDGEDGSWYAIVDPADLTGTGSGTGSGTDIELDVDPGRFRLDDVRLLGADGGHRLAATATDTGVRVRVPATASPAPVVIRFSRR